jgi:hypothetical protein
MSLGECFACVAANGVANRRRVALHAQVADSEFQDQSASGEAAPPVAPDGLVQQPIGSGLSPEYLWG